MAEVITPVNALVAIVLWGLLWDLWLRPVLNRREMAGFLSDPAGLADIVGAILLSLEYLNPKEKAALLKAVAAVLSEIGAPTGPGRLPRPRDIIAYRLLEPVVARLEQAAAQPGQPVTGGAVQGGEEAQQAAARWGAFRRR